MKRFFTILLAVVVSAGIMRATIYNGTCGSNISWELDTESGALVIEGTGAMPYWSNTSNVPWYNYRTSIFSVSISEGITTIANYAFLNCTKLATVSLPSTITELGIQAFSNTIITTISLPDELKSIKNDAFRSCYNLTSIVIPDNVTSIGTDIVCNCAKLESVSIGKSVKSIGSSAFRGCSKLTTVVWNAVQCADFSKSSSPFYYYSESYPSLNYDIRSQIKSFTIGNDVEYLPSYLCYGMTNIEARVLTCDIHCGLHAITNSAISQPGADLIQQPDTVICAGEMICKGEKQCTYSYSYYEPFDEDSRFEWNREAFENGEAQWPICYNCGEYEASDEYREFMEWINAQYIKHHVSATDATECPDGVRCTENCPDCKRYYYDTEIAFTYTNARGCDSIVTRNVIIDKIKEPKIETSPAKETLNSGTISLYDKNGNNWASYGYFTIDGEHIAHSSEHSETPYVHQNVTPGHHRLVFYSEKGCDSIETFCDVAANNMKVGEIYYNFIDEDVELWNPTTKKYETMSHFAEVTYRGESYSAVNEYSGNVIIPDSILWNDEYWPVMVIGEDAFRASDVKSVVVPKSVVIIKKNVFFECNKLSYIELKNDKCQLEYDKFYSSNWYYDTCAGLVWRKYNTGYGNPTFNYTTIPIYVPFGSLSHYWSNYMHNENGVLNFHVIEKNIVSSVNATSYVLTIGNTEEASHIVSCGIEGSDAEFEGNVLECIGLDPNSEQNISVYVNTIEGDRDTMHVSLTTTSLELITQSAVAVAEDIAILQAKTNLPNDEASCGFEWRCTEDPAEMASQVAYCPVNNGAMRGRLQGLYRQDYYKYRAFYKSSSEKMYYGDWITFSTKYVDVTFTPIVSTYPASSVTRTSAKLKGYAIEGAKKFTEQGFEYWVESRVTPSAPSRKAKIGEKKTIAASGISMSATLTDLDEGTVYRYRTYAKSGEETTYGDEMSFTTQGIYMDEATDIGTVQSDNIPCTKILRNGQILILRDGKVYTVTGQEVK